MAMSIRTNVASLNAQRALFNAGNDLSKSMQRLSSGYRINSSADDAAGMAISTKMQSQIGGLNQASMNAQDGISMIQTAEGALDEVTSGLQRMRDLSVQAANSTLSDTDRGNIDQEIQALYTNINNISSRTQFNGQGLLNGALAPRPEHHDVHRAGRPRADHHGRQRLGHLDRRVQGGGGQDLHPRGRHQRRHLEADQQRHRPRSTTSRSRRWPPAAPRPWTSAPRREAHPRRDGRQGECRTSSRTSRRRRSPRRPAPGRRTSRSARTPTRPSLPPSSTRRSATTNSDSAYTGLNTAISDFGAANGSTIANANTMLTAIDGVISSLVSSRAALGASQNSLTHTMNNLKTTSDNLSASNSRIRDVDVAAESAAMTRAQIISQSSVSVLAQANQMPQLALKLLG